MGTNFSVEKSSNQRELDYYLKRINNVKIDINKKNIYGESLLEIAVSL